MEYADDLVLAADSHETAQDLVIRLVTTLRKYNMKITPTKTVWMHIEGGEVPETLTVEGERIVLLQRVTYVGSALDANGDPSSAVRSNAQRAKQQIIRIRPLLKCSEVRKRCKATCIEAFVKPTLLYGLATIVLRATDDRKLSAVLNTGKRMALGCWFGEKRLSRN